MLDADANSKEEKLFKIALETRNSEISLFWQRANYFLALNIALAVGFFSVKDRDYSLLLAGLGAFASLLWLLVNLGGRYWQSRWEHELVLREQKLYPDDPVFAATRQQTEEQVWESWVRNHPGVSWPWMRRVVLLKPSASLMITILSIVFFFSWLDLLVQLPQTHSNPTWISSGMRMLLGFAGSHAPLLALIVVAYLLYLASAP